MLSITSADVVLYKTIFWVKGISSLEMLVVLALHANGYKIHHIIVLAFTC